LQLGVQIANRLIQAGVKFVTPAFPLDIQAATKAGIEARGTLWFYEEVTAEKTDYLQFGQLAKQLQTTGTEALTSAGLVIPDVLSSASLKELLDSLKESDKITDAEYALLKAWVPRIEKGVAKFEGSNQVLSHDDLWAKNTLMTPDRGLLLCDPDNFGWGIAEYDLAFISRGRENGSISKEELQQFEAGYGGRVPDINTAWKLALFHRFRWVCHLMTRRDWDVLAQKKLAAELPLWNRKKGPQP
jgi:hypothetical protein